MDTSQLYTSNTTGAMGEAAEGSSSSRRKRSREMESLSLEISKYPRDLLQRFMGSNQNLIQQTTAAKNEEREEDEDDDDDDDGLNLGLSLGGKFGVDKSHKRLIRASSVAGTIPLIREDDAVAPPPAAVQNLVRTSSLPSETEEEWRKRKELQTLRRMEAKRRRSEKQRSVKESGEERGGGGAGGEVSSVNLNFRGRLEREQQYLGLTNRLSSPAMGLPFGSPTNWPGGSASGSGGKQGGSGGDVEIKGKRSTFGSLQGFLAKHQQQASQGSVESQGGTSSGEAHQGSSSYGDTRSPASSHSLEIRELPNGAMRYDLWD